MSLPSDLLKAVSSNGKGQLALVLGAGCSVEAPTGIQVAAACSEEIYRRLVADGILQSTDCENPSDLSALADVVFEKYGSQKAVVDYLMDSYDMKLATPNEGYRILAALLCEGAVSSVVTLNYDLALSTALSDLGAPRSIGIVERPEDLERQRNTTVYYLHRNANAEDAETWVLRTAALTEEWRGSWEQIIATRVLSAPVVLFAGIGTPVSVLVESTKLLCASLPPPRKLFLAGPGNPERSKFFEELGISQSCFIQEPWGALMEKLSDRLVQEQTEQLLSAAALKIKEDGLEEEDLSQEMVALRGMGIVGFGKLRARWLLYEKPYLSLERNALGLLADILLALASIARLSGSASFILDDGRVEYRQQGRTVASIVVVSGSGHRGKSAIEAAMQSRRKREIDKSNAILVSGTAASWSEPRTPPEDIVVGRLSNQDLVRGPVTPVYLHVDELRRDWTQVKQVIL
jgi:hypothetical protein